MLEINFMTIGDSKFFSTVDISAYQLNKYYPNSKFFVYDWGFKNSEKKELEKYKNVEIINWKEKLNPFLLNINKFIKFIKYRIHLIEKIDNKLKRKKLELEYLYSQKPHCMLDCSKRINENLIFLDGDAFLINKIDEVFNDNFDIGVTLRPKEEIKFTKNNKIPPQVLNSGVIFFKSSSKYIELFIKRWIKETTITKTIYVEQSALTNLVSQTRQDIFKGFYKKGLLKINGNELIIKVFPCKKYNYNWIEKGFNKNKNKILHFKSGRFEKFELKKILKDIKEGSY